MTAVLACEHTAVGRDQEIRREPQPANLWVERRNRLGATHDQDEGLNDSFDDRWPRARVEQSTPVAVSEIG